IEEEVDNGWKTSVVRYLLWLFLGGFGGDGFYDGKIGCGIGLLILSLLSVWFRFGILRGVWVMIDGFLIRGWVREDEEKVGENGMEEI
ncbi:TM2 domain-containing protein, partial [Staphylococcus hominis]|uniref:TM2 domain-containing protein n=1 Tax=Staphylococcus hominis TaxID=1290 RepID=UPI0011A9A566